MFAVGALQSTLAAHNDWIGLSFSNMFMKWLSVWTCIRQGVAWAVLANNIPLARWNKSLQNLHVSAEIRSWLDLHKLKKRSISPLVQTKAENLLEDHPVWQTIMARVKNSQLLAKTRSNELTCSELCLGFSVSLQLCRHRVYCRLHCFLTSFFNHLSTGFLHKRLH